MNRRLAPCSIATREAKRRVSFALHLHSQTGPRTMSLPPPSRTTTQRCCACGSVLEVPIETVSRACTYCGSTLVDVERASVTVDRVAPFRIPRRAAEGRLREHLARAFWAPEALRQGARRRTLHARELRGVLVPFTVRPCEVGIARAPAGVARDLSAGRSRVSLAGERADGPILWTTADLTHEGVAGRRPCSQPPSSCCCGRRGC